MYTRLLITPQPIFRDLLSLSTWKREYRKRLTMKDSSQAAMKKIPTAIAVAGIFWRTPKVSFEVVSVRRLRDLVMMSWAMSPPLKKKAAM